MIKTLSVRRNMMVVVSNDVDINVSVGDEKRRDERKKGQQGVG